MKRSRNQFLRSIMKVGEVIQFATHIFEENGYPAPGLEAELLLAHLLGVRKIDLYLDHLRALSKEEIIGYESLVHQRLQGKPVAHILGEKEFWSLSFEVNSHCLIPRLETEILVEKALEVYRTDDPTDHPFTILDLGTGCGIIAICLAREIPPAHLTATDISVNAINIAKENARRHGVLEKIEFLAGDLFAPVRERKGHFDLIVSNPPYLTGKELEILPREIVAYEPRVALYGGEDGLSFYRAIIPESLHYLKGQGRIILEVGFGEASEVIEMLRGTDAFEEISVAEDLSGIPRVVSGRKNG